MAVGVRRLLLVSSWGTVYGPPQSPPITESHPTAPISPYGITKLTIDHYVLMFHHTRDLPVVVVRPANSYSIQQRSRTGQGFLARQRSTPPSQDGRSRSMGRQVPSAITFMSAMSPAAFLRP